MCECSISTVDKQAARVISLRKFFSHLVLAAGYDGRVVVYVAVGISEKQELGLSTYKSQSSRQMMP